MFKKELNSLFKLGQGIFTIYILGACKAEKATLEVACGKFYTIKKGENHSLLPFKPLYQEVACISLKQKCQDKQHLAHSILNKT